MTAEGITVLRDCCDWVNNMWKNKEIVKINERKDAGFSKPVVKRTDVKLIYD